MPRSAPTTRMGCHVADLLRRPSRAGIDRARAKDSPRQRVTERTQAASNISAKYWNPPPPAVPPSRLLSYWSLLKRLATATPKTDPTPRPAERRPYGPPRDSSRSRQGCATGRARSAPAVLTTPNHDFGFIHRGSAPAMKFTGRPSAPPLRSRAYGRAPLRPTLATREAAWHDAARGIDRAQRPLDRAEALSLSIYPSRGRPRGARLPG